MVDDMFAELDLYTQRLANVKADAKATLRKAVVEFTEANEVEIAAIAALWPKAFPPRQEEDIPEIDLDDEDALKRFLAPPEKYTPLQEQAREIHFSLKEKLESAISRTGFTYYGGVAFSDLLKSLDKDFMPNLGCDKHSVFQFETYAALARTVGRILVAQLGTDDFRATYWGAGCDPIAHEIPGKWKYVNLENMPQRWEEIQMVTHDVTSAEMPPEIPENSDDVAMIKTLGMAPHIEMWGTALRATRKDGLIVTSHDVPEQLSAALDIEKIVDLGDGRDRLEFKAIDMRGIISEGMFYFGEELVFYKLK